MDKNAARIRMRRNIGKFRSRPENVRCFELEMDNSRLQAGSRINRAG